MTSDPAKVPDGDVARWSAELRSKALAGLGTGTAVKRLGVVIVLALGFLTAGCGPNISGTVGIAISGSGEVLGISKGCGEKFGGATLYRDGPEMTEVANWDLAPGVDGNETFVWQLTGDVDDARFEEVPPLLKSSLEPSTQYTLRVGTADPATVIGDADFTGADVERLRPGWVLIADLANWDTDKQDYAPTMIVSRKRFDTLACSDDYMNAGN